MLAPSKSGVVNGTASPPLRGLHLARALEGGDLRGDAAAAGGAAAREVPINVASNPAAATIASMPLGVQRGFRAKVSCCALFPPPAFLRS